MKCAVVEKNVDPARVEFLSGILQYNGYTIVVVPSPPPKAAATPGAEPDPAPATFTVGVTDVTFNAVNAVFGRLLKAPGGHIVTLAYWKQQENVPDDEKPYFAGR